MVTAMGIDDVRFSLTQAAARRHRLTAIHVCDPAHCRLHACERILRYKVKQHLLQGQNVGEWCR